MNKTPYYSKGWALALAERVEQVDIHKHVDQYYKNRELTRAGISVAILSRFEGDTEYKEQFLVPAGPYWPWSLSPAGRMSFEKISNKTIIQKLTIAAAFLIAEIDRLLGPETEEEKAERLKKEAASHFDFVYTQIREDKDLWQVFQANIAVPMQDELRRFVEENERLPSSNEDFHLISNNAANYFLHLLTLRPEDFPEE